jgi:hypothetical protein
MNGHIHIGSAEDLPIRELAERIRGVAPAMPISFATE